MLKEKNYLRVRSYDYNFVNCYFDYSNFLNALQSDAFDYNDAYTTYFFVLNVDTENNFDILCYNEQGILILYFQLEKIINTETPDFYFLLGQRVAKLFWKALSLSIDTDFKLCNRFHRTRQAKHYYTKYMEAFDFKSFERKDRPFVFIQQEKFLEENLTHGVEHRIEWIYDKKYLDTLSYFCAGFEKITSLKNFLVSFTQHFRPLSSVSLSSLNSVYIENDPLVINIRQQKLKKFYKHIYMRHFDVLYNRTPIHIFGGFKSAQTYKHVWIERNAWLHDKQTFMIPSPRRFSMRFTYEIGSLDYIYDLLFGYKLGRKARGATKYKRCGYKFRILRQHNDLERVLSFMLGLKFDDFELIKLVVQERLSFDDSSFYTLKMGYDLHTRNDLSFILYKQGVGF